MLAFHSLFDGVFKPLLDQVGRAIENLTQYERTFTDLQTNYIERHPPIPTSDSHSMVASTDPDAQLRSSPEAANEGYEKFRKGIIKDRNS